MSISATRVRLFFQLEKTMLYSDNQCVGNIAIIKDCRTISEKDFALCQTRERVTWLNIARMGGLWVHPDVLPVDFWLRWLIEIVWY